jgi:hypothetical protein
MLDCYFFRSILLGLHPTSRLAAARAECQERAAGNWLALFQTNLRRHSHKSKPEIQKRPPGCTTAGVMRDRNQSSRKNSQPLALIIKLSPLDALPELSIGSNDAYTSPSALR